MPDTDEKKETVAEKEEIDLSKLKASDENIEIDASDLDESDDPDKKGSEKKDSISQEKFDALETKFDKLFSSNEDTQKKVKDLTKDKSNLNKALHEARQDKKTASTDEEVLSQDQLLKILEDNEGDAKTVLNIVKYQAEQAAKKVSGDTISNAEMGKVAKESNNLLKQMYPSINEDGSEMRLAINETKSYYQLDSHPLGDFFATGVQVLESLPGLIEAAEKRGKEEALKGTADDKRKDAIKDKIPAGKRGSSSTKGSLSETQVETRDQMNLTPGASKVYDQLVGKTGSVQVKEA